MIEITTHCCFCAAAAATDGRQDSHWVGRAQYMMPQNVIEYIGTHQLQALPAWQPKPKGFKVGGGGR